jgi:UDP-N-acetylmuramyl pentapeptide synthase
MVDNARLVRQGACETGMSPPSVFLAADHEELTQQLITQLQPGDWILLKGSRSTHMERVLELLRKAL